MYSAESTAKLICFDHKLEPTELRISQIAAKINRHLDDAFKLIKNINETSLSPSERVERLIEIERKFGIPKTHLL